MRVIYRIGRALFGGFFLYNGINHLRNTEALAGYAASKSTPSPRFDVQASGALLVATGASLAFGIKPRFGAAGAIAFLVGVTPLMHDFWTQTDPAQRQSDMIHFSKNLALLGAALAMFGGEPD